MAQNFGIGFVIGATVAASVNNAFSTVEQKIKSTRTELQGYRIFLATFDVL